MRRAGGIVMASAHGSSPPRSSGSIADVEPLGITLDVKKFERTTMYSKCEDPNSQWALCPSVS